jgi:hypothetical protein
MSSRLLIEALACIDGSYSGPLRCEFGTYSAWCLLIFKSGEGPGGFPSRGLCPIGPCRRRQARSTACRRRSGLIAFGAWREAASRSARRGHAFGFQPAAGRPGTSARVDVESHRWRQHHRASDDDGMGTVPRTVGSGALAVSLGGAVTHWINGPQEVLDGLRSRASNP